MIKSNEENAIYRLLWNDYIKVLGLNSKPLVISSTVLVFNTIIIKSLSSPERLMAKVNTLVFRTMVGVFKFVIISSFGCYLYNTS